MDYKIVAIEGNVLSLEDTVNKDEWGTATLMHFQMSDVDIFKVGDYVKITVIKINPT
jgi:hypothetical protein